MSLAEMIGPAIFPAAFLVPWLFLSYFLFLDDPKEDPGSLAFFRAIHEVTKAEERNVWKNALILAPGFYMLINLATLLFK